MKILILSLLFVVPAFAEEVPEYLKDGVISVTLKDGKVYHFSSNEYKVVKRGNEAEETLESVKLSQERVIEVQKKNRVRVLGGVAPSGLDTSSSGNTVSVKNKTEGVAGAGYDRMLTDKISVGGAALTNGTYTLGVGYDF